VQKDFEAAARTRTDWGLHAEIELRLDTRECVPYSFCKRFHFSRSETKGWGVGVVRIHTTVNSCTNPAYSSSRHHFGQGTGCRRCSHFPRKETHQHSTNAVRFEVRVL